MNYKNAGNTYIDCDQKVRTFFDTHRKAFRNWEHGEPVRCWRDEQGVLCIEYEDGSWWHYKVENGELIWW